MAKSRSTGEASRSTWCLLKSLSELAVCHSHPCPTGQNKSYGWVQCWWAWIYTLSLLFKENSVDCQLTRQKGDVVLFTGQERTGNSNSVYYSILARKIPWTEEPGMLYSPWGWEESDTTEWLCIDRLLQRFMLNSLSGGHWGAVERYSHSPPRGVKMELQWDPT